MEETLGTFIIALISYVIYSSGVYFVKKTTNKLNGVLWIPITFWLSVCFNALVVGVINLICIPITLISVSIINLLFGIALWWFIVTKGRQKYEYSLCDCICFLPIVLIAFYFGIQQFGKELLPLYATSDPGAHFKMAVHSLLSEKVKGMYFAEFFNGMVMDLFSTFVKSTQLYRVFVLIDVAMFALSGILFYCVTANLTKKVGVKVIALIMALFYMIGYPLNNLAFGFVYLGMGVNILLVILFLTEHYINEKLDRRFNVLALMTTCFSIAICYSIFAPVTFVGVFISVAVCFVKKKRLISWQFVLEELKIFLIPCILAFYYFIITWGPNSNAMSNEGYVYRNLFSNFVFLLAPMLIAIIFMIRKRKNDEVLPMFAVLLLWIGATFILGLKGNVSSYYYFKSYFVLWALCFYLAYKAVLIVGESTFSYVVAYVVAPILLFFVGTFNIENKIQEINNLFTPELYADKYFDIYHSSANLILNDNEEERRQVWRARAQLYEFAYEQCGGDEQVIPLIDDWQSIYWYEGVMGKKNVYWWKDKDGKLQEIQNSDYVIVIPDTELYSSGDAFYEEYAEYYNSLEKVFENELGFVAKIK